MLAAGVDHVICCPILPSVYDCVSAFGTHSNSLAAGMWG
jgi:hypothetical protein